MKEIFKAEQFVATKWNSAVDKAKFANHFIRFIESGYKESLFNKKFYNRLSMTFGHIAHYNKYGFYDTWFSSREKQKEFIRHTLKWNMEGDPAWTYSDVEKAIHKYLKTYTEKNESYRLPL